MRWMGMPLAIWVVFAKSFQAQLTAVLGYDPDTARKITEKAKPKYREIIAKLPEFEHEHHWLRHAGGVCPLHAAPSRCGKPYRLL